MERAHVTDDLIGADQKIIRQDYGTRIEPGRELTWQIMAEEERLNEALI